jgi:hypothetical protein
LAVEARSGTLVSIPSASGPRVKAATSSGKTTAFILRIRKENKYPAANGANTDALRAKAVVG